MKTKLFFALFLVCFAYSHAIELNVSKYRWRNDDGGETTATWKAAENTPITIGTDDIIRLRLAIVVTASPGQTSHTLQYTTSDPVTANDWVPISDTSIDFIATNASTNVTNDEPTTQQLSDVDPSLYSQGIIVADNIAQSTYEGLGYSKDFEYVIKPTASTQNTTYYFKISSGDATHDFYPSLTYDSTLSTQDNILDRNDYSYLNPVSNELKIESKSQIDNVKIYSILGNLVKQDTKHTLNTSDLSAGMYIVKMHTVSGKNATFKIVKE